MVSRAGLARVASAACAMIAGLAACQVVTGLHGLSVVDAGEPAPAAATDPADAGAPSSDAEACPTEPGHACDVLTQCGCRDDQSCRPIGSPPTGACVPAGALAPGSTCERADDCPRGQTCDAAVCRAHCRVDADCGDGRCVPAEAGRLRVCWERCDERGDCGPGARCRASQPPGGGEGRYCAAPADPCPSAEDGVCDEAEGTGECADGTDARDCNCEPSAPGAPCNLIEQCGCPKGRACVVTPAGEGHEVRCAVWEGTKRQNEVCVDSSECAAGHVCLSHGVCGRICTDDDECSTGRCLRVDRGGAGALEIEACHWACDRADPACGPAAQCARFDDRFELRGDFCAVPREACLERDGVCDEPSGAAICRAGADPFDCCRPSIAGGRCNLVLQCGCSAEPGASCIESSTDSGAPTTVCGVAGQKPPSAFCRENLDCSAGAGCFGNVCRPYCATDGDCGEGGRCIAMTRSSVGPPISVCLGPCDPVSQEPCGQYTSCKSGLIGSNLATACTFEPLTDACPKDNGRCDEPEGTGVCVEGSDPEC